MTASDRKWSSEPDTPFSKDTISEKEENVNDNIGFEDIYEYFSKLSVDDYTEETSPDIIASDSVKYSLVTDRDTINALENDKHRTTYRAMLLIDGKFIRLWLH